MTYGLRAMRRPLMRDPRLLIDWTGGTPFPAGSYTRASDGATRGADGVWRQVAAGVPRTTWRRDASGLLVPATLTELAATNEARYSEPTVAQLATAGPGVLDATWPNASFARAVQVPADTGQDERAYVSHGNLAAQEGATYTVSLYVYMEDGAGPPAIAQSAGAAYDFAITAQGMLTGTQVVRIEDVGGSIYRVVARRPITNVTNATTGVLRYATNRQRPFRVTGFQVEDALNPTTIIRTDGAAATRARDTLYLDLPPEIRTPGAALAIYARYIVGADPTGFATSPVAWGIAGASGAAPRLYHYPFAGDRRLALRHDNGVDGAFRSATANATATVGDLVESLSLIWADSAGLLTGRLIAAINRGPLAADDLPPLAPAAAWSAPRLYVGSRGTAPGVYEWGRLAVWSGFWAGDDERRFARARGEI